MREKIYLLIVDDHPLFREGVITTLRADPDIELVGQGTTADDAVRLVGELLPDVLLLDLAIPGGGLRAAQTIATAYPVVKIVILTASEEEDDVLAALKLGARGYIVKGVSAPELIDMIHTVASGAGSVLPSLATSLLAEISGVALAQRASASPLDELSDRERQILECVANGLSNKEIGYTFGLSEKTIKAYMTNILQKLQVRSRVEAALLAQKSRHADER